MPGTGVASKGGFIWQRHHPLFDFLGPGPIFWWLLPLQKPLGGNSGDLWLDMTGLQGIRSICSE